MIKHITFMYKKNIYRKNYSFQQMLSHCLEISLITENINKNFSIYQVSS